MTKVVLFLFANCLALASLAADKPDYSSENNPLVGEFIAQMVSEHKFEASYLADALAGAKRKQSIIDAISRPAEKALKWHQYRRIFLTQKRISQGVSFWQEHKQTLLRAEKQYGVPAHIIVAILGVETSYGRNRGSYRVLDALSTLGFDYPPRASFFRRELAQFFLLTRENKLAIDAPMGSYAGAMGYGQFIPSSYRSYAVDYDGDDLADIWQNPVDAIGSIANYFAKHGWKNNAAIVVGANYATDTKTESTSWLNKSLKPQFSVQQLLDFGMQLPDESSSLDVQQNAAAFLFHGSDGPEYFLGLHNFYVITRYNHSKLYAMAVYDLSQAVSEVYQQQTVMTSAHADQKTL